MPTDHRHLGDYLKRLLEIYPLEELNRRMKPKFDPAPAGVPGGSLVNQKAVDKRWGILNASREAKDALLDASTREIMASYRHNIENFIGAVKLPVGLAGPLRVNGLFAQGDYYIPLATTEAALVASYNRGSNLLTHSGGCTTILINEGITRAPGFAFNNIRDAGNFVIWAVSQVDSFREAAESTTQHGRLIDMKVTLEGNHVYLTFEFITGDASGQNMVTIATEAICSYIKDNSPIPPDYLFVEANLSGDKKASAQSFLTVRGKKVSAEAVIPSKLLQETLHVAPHAMVNYWKMSAIGGVMSGTIGVHGHYANGLAALYIACGQDAACVAESAVGVTRFDMTAEGDLYASVTLPNLVVGTVGGGTSLPSQKACLEIMGLAGAGKSRAFAEVCAALALAGELSIIGSLAAGDFTRAHRKLARARKNNRETRVQGPDNINHSPEA